MTSPIDLIWSKTISLGRIFCFRQRQPTKIAGRPMARRFMEILVIPWVDKTIAVLASVPFAVELYRRWTIGNVSFPRAVLGLQLLVVIGVMVLRTAPVRVTPNPWFWLLAFVTSYGWHFPRMQTEERRG